MTIEKFDVKVYYTTLAKLASTKELEDLEWKDCDYASVHAEGQYLIVKIIAKGINREIAYHNANVGLVIINTKQVEVLG